MVAPAVDPGVIYTVSVADAWTKELAEIARAAIQAARGIVGVVHKVKNTGVICSG